MLKNVGLGTWIVEKCRVREHELLKNVGLGAWTVETVRVRSMDC